MEEVKAKSIENAHKRRQARTGGSNSNSSLVPNSSSNSLNGEGNNNSSSTMTAKQVTQYLLKNPKFLERHVARYVDGQTLRRWMTDKKLPPGKKALDGKGGGKPASRGRSHSF